MKPVKKAICSLAVIFAIPLFARDFSSPVGGNTSSPPQDKNSGDASARNDSTDKKPADVKEDAWTWKEHVVPGPAVALRIKRSPNKELIYEGSMERSQRSNASYSEQDSFYLTVLCADQKEVVINGQNKVLDMLAMRRTYTDRKRTESFESGRANNVILPNLDELISLGPNFDLVNSMHCYAFDNQNIMASRTEQVLTLKDDRQLHGRIASETADKIVFATADDTVDVDRSEVVATSLVSIPHVFMNESPHYMFPLLSERTVSPGDTWPFKVPIIIPIEQGRPARIWPTQFSARMVGRLREVREGKGGRIAVVDYHVSGLFDSQAPEFAGRFPADFHANNRLMHKVSGDGTILIDVENGRILEKSEQFNVTLQGNSLVIQGADKPAKQENHKAEIKSNYRIKLLTPGTRLKNGVIIPAY